MAAEAQTRARLLAAAGELFGARGFRGTTIRAVATRARANVAAAHYHFGSKEALYLAVLRAQFADIRARLAARGAAPSPAELSRLDDAEVVRRLRARVYTMLELLLGPPPGLHGTLMQREMVDPSAALPVIADEFIAPVTRELHDMVKRLAPGSGAATVERCADSIVGQALFYRFAMPLLMRRWKHRAYTRAQIRALADHITDFSLAAMPRGRRMRRAG
jgi:AcrR family transcriptional regulator